VVGVWTMPAPSARRAVLRPGAAARSVVVSTPVEDSNRTIAQPMARQAPAQPPAHTQRRPRTAPTTPAPMIPNRRSWPLARAEAPRKVVKPAPTVGDRRGGNARPSDGKFSLCRRAPGSACRGRAGTSNAPRGSPLRVVPAAAPIDVSPGQSWLRQSPERNRAIQASAAPAGSARPASDLAWRRGRRAV